MSRHTERVRHVAVPDTLAAEAVAWRHALHRHPEILFDVHHTSDFVAARLQEFGCEVVRGLGRTGVVGLLRGKADSAGRVAAFRADMDALPLTETAAVPYRSSIDGRMHACGHDGHMAMLLGAARYLSRNRNFDGTLAFVFQPAEEGGAGARVMIEDGLMERFAIQHVFGMHIMPGLPVGDFGMRDGVIMAASDRFTCTIRAEGGHAAMPHHTADPVLTACQAVVALQSIVARRTDPLRPAVLSVTTIESGTAFNVIPGKATFGGTFRTTDPETREMVRQQIETVVAGVAGAMGARAEFSHMQGYPNTVNHPEPTQWCHRAATRVVGGDRVDAATAPVMAAEDFSFMLEKVPGSFVFLGNGDSAELHSPNFVFDDEALPAGIAYWVSLAGELLGTGD